VPAEKSVLVGAVELADNDGSALFAMTICTDFEFDETEFSVATAAEQRALGLPLRDLVQLPVAA
jgi:hypothetical protein